MRQSLTHIREYFAQQRREHKAWHWDIAEQLSISEAELLAAHIGATDASSALSATRLNNNWPAIIASIESLGTVMGLTRTNACVHEVIGAYSNCTYADQIGTISNETMKLRINYAAWCVGFAIVEEFGNRVMRSLQFFGADGRALHKIYLRADSDLDAFFELIRLHRAEQQAPEILIDKTSSALTPASRAQYRTPAGDNVVEFVRQFERDECMSLLNAAALQAVPLTICVANEGILQSYFGRIHKVVQTGPWLNVLDPTFNIHLREDNIANIQLVQNASAVGCSTYLELLDANEETIARISGAGSSKQTDSSAWRSLLAHVEQGVQPCAS